MKRRNFLRTLGALGAGTLLSPTAYTAEPSVAPPPPTESSLFALPPYAQFTAPGVMDIRWRTTKPATAFVAWTQEPPLPRDQWPVAYRTEDGLIAANETQHHVTLRGLDPTRPLLFEALSEPIHSFGAYRIQRGTPVRSGVRSLRPLLSPEGDLSIAIFNDLHGKTPHIPRFLNTAPAQAVAPTLALFNGDCLTDCGTREAAEKTFLSALPPLTELGHPVLFLRGNHEYRGAMARRIRTVLSPFAQTHAYYGAFTLGAVRFICLDTGEDKRDDVAVYGGLMAADAYLQEQAEWFAREIERPEHREAPWRVAIFHIPPYQANPKEDAWYGPTRLRTLFDPLFAKANLTAMICGHTHHHSLQTPEASGRPYPIFIAGGHHENNATLLLLQANAKTFSLTATRLDGTPLGATIRATR